MPFRCPPCRQLLTHGKRHSQLVTLSHLRHSELAKCSNCLHFYLCEQGHWESLSDTIEAIRPATSWQHHSLLQN